MLRKILSKLGYVQLADVRGYILIERSYYEELLHPATPIEDETSVYALKQEITQLKERIIDQDFELERLTQCICEIAEQPENDCSQCTINRRRTEVLSA